MQPIDLWLIASYLLATAAFGIWLGRGQSSQADYFLGGRQVPAFALLLSIVATETSTVTFLSIPGLSFKSGGSFLFLQLATGYIVGRLIVAALLLPLHFSRHRVTAYEVLQDCYGKLTRQVASVIFVVARTIGDGLRLFLTALALNQAVGWSVGTCVVVIALVTGLYASVGGVKSVVWNDCLQFAIYTIGAIAALFVILNRIPGGLQQIWRFAQVTGRDQFIDLSPQLATDHVTFWSGLIGGSFLTLATHGADQLIVQRYLCAKNERSAAWALVLSGPVVFLQFALFLLIGLALACYFTQADPSRLGLSGDAVLANFVVTEVPVGLRGLIIAAVLAAAMSTLSSSVNSSASSLLYDLAGDALRPLPEPTKLLLAKVSVVGFTIAQALVAIAAYRFAQGDLVVTQVLGVAGFAASLLLGLYLLGLIVGTAESWQAIGAIAVGGLANSVALARGIHPFWFPLIGCGATMLTGLVLVYGFSRKRNSPSSPTDQ